jgi:uncharacterized membrane protein YjfL (UPF0719 family)
LDSLEAFVLVVSVIVSTQQWFSWYRGIFEVNRLGVPWRQRVPLSIAPPLCMAILFTSLRKFGDDAVRHNFWYLLLYLSLGAAWLAGIAAISSLLGVSARDDALERANHSATWAVSGALVGATFCFAGANIGNGPGVEVVLFSAFLATGLFLLLWLVAEWFGTFSEEITVERNLGAGIRLGGFLAAIGILCGWTVTGDWVSVATTLNDFGRSAWPAILLSAVVIVIEAAKKTSSRPPSKGALGSIALAFAYIASASAWVIARGLR